jgi:hypothetical protein
MIMTGTSASQHGEKVVKAAVMEQPIHHIEPWHYQPFQMKTSHATSGHRSVFAFPANRARENVRHKPSPAQPTECANKPTA